MKRRSLIFFLPAKAKETSPDSRVRHEGSTTDFAVAFPPCARLTPPSHFGSELFLCRINCEGMFFYTPKTAF